MRATVMLGLTLCAGCELYFGDDDSPPLVPDARVGQPPDAGPADCLPETSRTADCEVDVGGELVDFTTGAPVGPAQLRVTTAWDTVPFFPPVSCPALGFVTAGADGLFDALDVRCDSPAHPPVLLVTVDDPPGGADLLAPFAVDQRLTCLTSPPQDCGSAGGVIAVPSAAMASAWRTELAAGGMPNAAQRGLVLYAFFELDGSPATGVVPTIREGTVDRVLIAGTEVRFVAGDLESLVRADAGMTGTSGIAIIALAGDAALIGGLRGTERWDPVGVMVSPGWWFYETRTISP